MKGGLTETQANALRSQAVKNGSISSVAGAAQAAVDKKKEEREAQRQKLIARNEERAPIDIDRVNQLVAEANAQKALENFRAGEQQVYDVAPASTPTKNWWEGFVATGKEMVTAVIEKGKEIVAATIEKGKELVDAGKEFVNKTIEKGKDLVDAGKEFVNKTIEKGKEIVTATIEKGRELVEKGKEFAKTATQTGMSALGSVLSPAKDIGGGA
ncbi:MAG: hypothetical protein MUO77_08295 [Anaerolineales bacterium]|nr:hypothetical protein [Anaerolineales bacterium]